MISEPHTVPNPRTMMIMSQNASITSPTMMSPGRSSNVTILALGSLELFGAFSPCVVKRNGPRVNKVRSEVGPFYKKYDKVQRVVLKF
jgi:hypothetical protein